MVALAFFVWKIIILGMGDSSSIWKRFTTNSSKSSNSGTSTTARNQHYAGASGASVKGHSDPDSNDDDNYNKKGTIMTAQSTTSTTTGSTPTAGTPTRNSSPASCSNGGKHHHPNKSNSSIHSNSSSSSNGNNRWNATHSPRKLMPASKISKGGGPPMFAPLWHFVKHHRNRDGMLLLVLWLASVMVGSILLSVVQQKTLPFRKRLNHRLLLLFRIEIVKRGQTPGRRHIAVRQNHYTTTSPTNAAADGSSTLPAIINNNDPATSTALKLRRSKADHRPSLLITNPLLMKECLTVTAKNRRLMSDWTVTNLGQAPDYPHYRELSDIFDGPGVWTTKRHLQRHSNTNNNSFSLNNESEQEQRVVEAVCVFRPLQYSKHFPHM